MSRSVNSPIFSMKSAIIIPTYNERDNIRKLIARLLQHNIEDLHCVIVDDNSPDGTGAIADELAESHSHVHVIHRKKKEGLGKAYIAGFERGFELHADVLFTMDADFSHDPSIIPSFLEAIEDADVVIGSRYVEGGAIKNWSWIRRFISKMGNLYARTVLQTGIRDMTTGYRCYRRKVLESIDLNALSSGGYVVLVELAYKSFLHAFQIKEIPITFTERATGKSKFSMRIFVEAWIQVFRLRRMRKSVKPLTTQ